MLGIDRLAYWAKQCGFGEKTGIDLPGEAAGIVPSNEWKGHARPADLPGRGLPGGHRPGLRRRDADPAASTLRALANGGKLYRPQIVHDDHRARRHGRPAFTPKVHPQGGRRRSVLKIMRVAARNVVVVRHTYNFVDLPIVVAASRERPSSASATARAACRSTRGSSVSCRRTRQERRSDGFDDQSTDSPARVLAFAYDSRTKGNAATEIVKYFLQLHFTSRRTTACQPAEARQLLWRLRRRRWAPIASDRAGARSASWAATSVGARRGAAFDLQLAVYAGLLAIARARDGLHATASSGLLLAGGSMFLRGADVAGDRDHRLHRRDGLRLPVAQDVRVADLPRQPRAAGRHAGASATASAGRRAGSRSSAVQFQFSELAKILMIVVLANYLGAAPGQPRLARGRSRRLHPRRTAADPRACSSRTSARRSCSARSSPGCCSCPARACAGSGAWRVGGHRRAPDRLDVRPARLPEAAADVASSTRRATRRAPATSCSSRRSRSGPAGCFGKGLTNGTQTRRPPAGPGHRLRLRDRSPRSWASSARSWCSRCSSRCCGACWSRGWRSRDPFGLMFAPGSRRWCCSSWSSTSAWCSASCPSPASRCRSSRTAAPRSSASPLGLGILQSINIRQTRAEW